ncbi:uncharacterized protein LOC128955382 [Oppia nitens]|uniref:uncharacterized protein LOC128955382 n=1 Tax=Oppia nitens TaxID=1686743 RepID=UPI0023DBBAE8|nr:uncharacterized protein LOC128955382 [Oppia nitens]
MFSSNKSLFSLSQNKRLLGLLLPSALLLGTVSRRHNHFSHRWQPLIDRPLRRQYCQQRCPLRSVHMFDEIDDNTTKNKDIMDLVFIKNKCLKSVIIPYSVSLADSRKTLSNGTGIVVDISSHLCITNAHVVKGCTLSLVWINIQGNQVFEVYGDCIYVEQHLDLALVRLRDIQESRSNLEKLYVYHDWEPQLGQPVASFGNGNTLNMIGDGIVVRHMVYPNDIDGDSYTVSLTYVSTADSTPTSFHTASSSHGFSGGPVIDTEGDVVGILWGSTGKDEGPYCFIYNKRVYEFIKRSKTYIQTKLPSVLRDRHLKWSPLLKGGGGGYGGRSGGRKLGLIYAEDDIGMTTILGFLPESDVYYGGNSIICRLLPGIQCIKPDINLEELIDETIVAINGQQFDEIRQLIDAVDNIGTDDGESDSSSRKKMTLTVSGVHNAMDIEMTANLTIDDMPIEF